MLATIELVDGTELTANLPVTPDLDVSKVIEICSHYLELEDPRMSHLGIFVIDIPDTEEEKARKQRKRMMSGRKPPAPTAYSDLPLSPRPLRNDSFLGTVFMKKLRAGQKYKFVLKRKIYLKDTDLGPSDDPMFQRLTYLQGWDEVNSGNIPIDDENAVLDLIAISMGVDYCSDVPCDTEYMMEQPFQLYIPRDWADRHTDEEWAGLIADAAARKVDAGEINDEVEAMQDIFLDAIVDSEFYGASFFHVKICSCTGTLSFPDHFVIMFNSDGLSFMDVDWNIFASFGYPNIYRWGGSSSQFSLVIWDSEADATFDLVLHTGQAPDMAALILDYITAIMDAQ